jgi:hypothetical protein
MELTFTELGNVENCNTYYDDLIPQKRHTQETSHYNNYNDTIQKTQGKRDIPKQKRKTISYDDILSSMNTVVIDGKLEFISKDNLQNIVENQQQKQPQQNKKKVSFNQQEQYHSQNIQQPQISKNSYIYNKFFKDYKEPSSIQNEQPMRPLTKNELIKQLIINKVNAINEKNRIAQIKSTKLLFNNNNNRNIIINSTPNPNGMNHLFNFR